MQRESVAKCLVKSIKRMDLRGFSPVPDINLCTTRTKISNLNNFNKFGFLERCSLAMDSITNETKIDTAKNMFYFQ